MTCPYCANPSGMYDFANLCCRVRFVVGQPLREVRSAWLDRWKKQLSNSDYSATEKAVRDAWAQRKRG